MRNAHLVPPSIEKVFLQPLRCVSANMWSVENRLLTTLHQRELKNLKRGKMYIWRHQMWWNLKHSRISVVAVNAYTFTSLAIYNDKSIQIKFKVTYMESSRVKSTSMGRRLIPDMQECLQVNKYTCWRAITPLGGRTGASRATLSQLLASCSAPQYTTSGPWRAERSTWGITCSAMSETRQWRLLKSIYNTRHTTPMRLISISTSVTRPFLSELLSPLDLLQCRDFTS